MDREEFHKRLLTATGRALSIARKWVINYLPDEVRYRLLLNSSYDGNRLAGDEQIFVHDVDTGNDSVPVEIEQVVSTLWRNGKVPEWIDMYVDSADEKLTFVNLRCCGRFTALDDFLYHQSQRIPPFHVQSPHMPPDIWGSQKQEKFDLLWRRKKMEQERGSLYPDVTEHGSLGRLLNSHLVHIGSSLKVRGFEEDGWSRSWARAEKDGRGVQISSALKERLFLTDFWDRGVKLAGTKTGDLIQLVNCLQAWCVDGRSTSDLRRISPQTEFDAELVAAFGVSPEAFTSRRWEKLLEAASDHPQNDKLKPVVQEASRTPALRRLWPFTSMMRLGFSRCTGYPFSGDCPLICPVLPVGSGYQVIGGTGEVVGEGDAQEAVALAVQHLPPGCGPAVHGTASDLRNS